MFASDGPLEGHAEEQVEDPVAALATVLDVLADENPAGEGAAALAESTLTLERLSARLDAERIRRLGHVDTHQAWSLDGSRSPAAWLARNSGMGHGEATRRFKAARTLRDLPAVSAGFAQGRLSFAQVRWFCELVDDHATDAVRDALVDAEEALVDAVAELGERDTRKALRYWWGRVDPAGYQDRWDDLYEQRGLSASETFHGAVAVNGMLDPDNGQVFLRALSALEEVLWRQDQAAVARGELSARTAGQRRADALALMAEISLDHLGEPAADTNDPDGATDADGGEDDCGCCGDAPDTDLAADPGDPVTDDPRDSDDPRHHPDAPGRGRLRAPRTYGTVTVDLPTLAGLTGSAHPAGVSLLERDPARWGGATLGPQDLPLPLEAARRLCCDAGLSLVVTDGRGLPLDVGRTSRTATPAIRRALEIRDRGCAFGGCTMPAAWCDAHHIAWWTRDHGPTTLANLVLLCRHHHRLLHEGGWRCWLDDQTGRPCFAPAPGHERAPPHQQAA